MSGAYIVGDLIKDKFPKLFLTLECLERIIMKFKLTIWFHLKILVIYLIADTLKSFTGW